MTFDDQYVSFALAECTPSWRSPRYDTVDIRVLRWFQVTRFIHRLQEFRTGTHNQLTLAGKNGVVQVRVRMQNFADIVVKFGSHGYIHLTMFRLADKIYTGWRVKLVDSASSLVQESRRVGGQCWNVVTTVRTFSRLTFVYDLFIEFTLFYRLNWLYPLYMHSQPTRSFCRPYWYCTRLFWVSYSNLLPFAFQRSTNVCPCSSEQPLAAVHFWHLPEERLNTEAYSSAGWPALLLGVLLARSTALWYVSILSLFLIQTTVSSSIIPSCSFIL